MSIGTNSMSLEVAVAALKAGKVLCVKTDTVWGVACAVSYPEAIERIYQIKGRDHGKPCAMLVDSIHMATQYGELDGRSNSMAEKFWPGAVTLVVPAKMGRVPAEILGGWDKVGLRVPNDKACLMLITALGEAMVATSANFSGKPAPVSLTEIEWEFLELTDGVFGVGSGSGLASTVLDTTEDEFKVIREGEVKV